jgi:cytochrome b involved in lipid metabolism
MRTSTIVFSAIIILLLVASGVGIWALSQKQTQAPPNTKSEQTRSFTMEEVAQHNSRKDCWTVISGEVYDLTDFVISHPGGNEILRACGIDATSLFNERETADGQPVGSGTPHSQTARERLKQLKIGSLVEK